MADKELNKRITMRDIFQDGGVLSESNKNYKERPKQIEGAETIQNAIDSGAHVILEGECGFGKSFAYLFPILNAIAESNFEKVAVISTSGISLQEQLYTKDLPFAVDIMKKLYPNWKKDFKFTLLKGRQNFLCIKKVMELGIYHQKKGMIDGKYLPLQDFVDNTKTGDLSDLNFIPKNDVLHSITCSQKGECTGKKCEHYGQCFYAKHRRNINTSNVIVTNYHMFFSDLSIGGKILPPYEILVFDEAHEASSIFRDFQSCKLSIHTLFNIRNKISELHNISQDRYESRLGHDLMKDLIRDFEICLSEIQMIHPDLDSPKIVYNMNGFPPSYVALGMQASKILDIVEGIIESRDDLYIDYDDEEVGAVEAKISTLLTTIGDALIEVKCMTSYIQQTVETDNKVVWIEKINDVISVNYKDIEVGQEMNRMIFGRENLTCLLTSATISVGGTFDYIKSQTGINVSDKPILEFMGGSPFNLTEQQLWYLPENAMDGNKFGFDRTIAPSMLEIIDATQGGALCLFTSIKNMRYVATYLEREIGHKYKILVQGEAPRTKLVEQFRKNGNAVLLATKSFFTGVDVQGSALRAVIIDKLPFIQPTEPVQQVLMDKDNAFFKYAIPEMIIALRQAVGRGVRSVDDKCVIAILDGRMATARYRARINKSFDYEKTGTRSIQDVKDFITNWLGDIEIKPELMDTNEWDDELGDYGQEEPF